MFLNLLSKTSRFTSLFILCLGLLVSNTQGVKADESDDETEEAQPSRRVDLARFSANDEHIAAYTQKLFVNERTLSLTRASTQPKVQYVTNGLKSDKWKSNHLLAQGVCRTADKIRSHPFTTSLNVTNKKSAVKKAIDWTSNRSTLKSSTLYECHRSHQGNGHSEPQFIADFNDVLNKTPDALVSLFVPPSDIKTPVHMCGLELFSSYDICDVCLRDVTTLRKEQQSGCESISDAIRDRLRKNKTPFKGEKEDAFVVMYHGQYPYKPIDTYALRDEENPYRLKYGGLFGTEHHQFIVQTPDTFTEGSNTELSQNELHTIEKDIIYGHIHHIGDRTTPYESGHFSFR